MSSTGLLFLVLPNLHIDGSFTNPFTCTLVNFTGETKNFLDCLPLLYSCETQTESIFKFI